MTSASKGHHRYVNMTSQPKLTTADRLTLRVAVEVLSNHIDQLCHFISDHSLEIPSMDTQDHATLLKILTHQRIPLTILSKELRVGLTTDDNCFTDHSHLVDHSDVSANVRYGLPESVLSPARSTSTSSQWVEPDFVSETTIFGPSTKPQFEGWSNSGESAPATLSQNVWSWGQDEDANVSCQPFSHSGKDVGVTIPCLDIVEPDQVHSFQVSQSYAATQHPEGHSDIDSTETLVDQLSERIGSMHIEPGGHIRYYGPTSNFNLVKMPIPDMFNLHRTLRNNGQDYLDRLNLGKEAPPALEDHLINLYFSWQDPALHVVNRDMFEAARVSWKEMNDTPYYSEVLHNSM